MAKQDKGSISGFWHRLVDLRDGLDKEGTIASIKNNNRMEGANAWLLMCSIMIASLGLDLNSQAIIIGAMLISPLMSPILGLGLGVGINDRETLMISTRHFGIAIAIALVTSTTYFFITPFGEITEEITRRTEPTFLDILVAFFGGVAGIISGSRADKGSAIPGVAIATALMPPLCVSGFGIAKGLEWLFGISTPGVNYEIADFILNAFYLFFLNSFFVALATFIFVRQLRFPVRKYIDPKARRRTFLYMIIFSVIMAIPSFFILREVLVNLSNKRHIENFVQNYIGDDAKYIDETKLIETEEGYRLIMKVYGSTIAQMDSTRLHNGLRASGLINCQIEIIPTSEIDLQSFEKLESRVIGFDKTIEERLQAARRVEDAKEIQIRKLQSSLDSLQLMSLDIESACEGARTLIPGIETLAYSYHVYGGKAIPTFFITWKRNARPSERQEIKQNLEEYLKNQLTLEELKLVSVQ